MRINRRSLEARLKKAEHAIAFRVVDRAAELLRAEMYALPMRAQVPLMRAVDRARRSGAAPRDAVGVLLREIAAAEPELAGRIGRAVGVEVPVRGAAIAETTS